MNENKAKISVLLIRGLIGGAIGAIANLVVFVIGKAAGISFEIAGMNNGADPVQLNFAAILISSLVPAIAAILILIGLNSYSKNPFRVFLLVGVGALLVSFFPVFSIEVPQITKIFLGIMHIIAALSIIGFLKTAFKKEA